MLKTILFFCIFLLLAIGGGAGSVLYALARFEGAGAVTVGPWTTFPKFGTPAADPYAKARFARQGGLSLGQAEGISFTAAHDSDGRPLTGKCSYGFIGLIPPARFWTLHATDPTGHPLHGIGRKAPAVESRSLLRRPDNAVAVEIGAHVRPGNWLPIAADGAFRLVLTLYDTPISGEAGVVDVTLPKIRREECRG